jgi:FAD synthase
VFLIHDFDNHDFYGEYLEVKIKSFIRAETLFSTFDDLILAIHCDIESA